MAGFCLVPQVAAKFLAEVRNGSLTAQRLMAMTSEQRRQAFAKVVGEEHAEPVNAAFESKLLLANQQKGIASWIQKTAGLTPEVRRDLLSRVERMDSRVLEPAQMADFLADLAKQKLGVGVTMQEAGEIARLAKDVSTAKTAAQFDPATGVAAGGPAAAKAYGYAAYDFGEYVKGLKQAVLPTVGKHLAAGEYGAAAREGINALPGIAKSVNSTLDNSGLFRQGDNMLKTHPTIWAKNAAQSFAHIARTLKGEHVMRDVMADILAMPNHVNGRFRKMGLDIGMREEAFPVGMEKVGGRVYRAAEDAFTAFNYRNRADAANLLLKAIDKANLKPESFWNPHLNTSDAQALKSLGSMINSLTARGSLGPAENLGKHLNVAFFSPKKLAADFDVLTAHSFRKDVEPFVRKEAAKNLAKIIGVNALIMVVANYLKPGSAETDWRSSDAGQIRVGNTRFDYSGGKRSIATLAARLAAMLTGHDAVKSSTTGKMSKLNTGGYASPTGLSLIEDFFENKTSPFGSVIKTHLTGENFKHEAPTLGGDLSDLFLPMPIKAYQELANTPGSAGVLAGMMADAVGIGQNTYDGSKTKRQNVPYFPSLPDFSFGGDTAKSVSVPVKPAIAGLRVP